MSRGKTSCRALDSAVAAAGARGEVIFLQASAGPVCDFLVLSPYGIVAVTVRRTRRIRADIAEIAMVHNETLNRIRAADRCPSISCEFWLWAPHGTMRFFQLEGTGLFELNPQGLPLFPPVSGRFAGPPANQDEAVGKNPAGIPAGQNGSPAPAPDMAAEQKPGGASSSPGQTGTREPHYIRFLRWRNAEMLRRKEETAGGPVPAASPVPPQTGGNVSPP